MLPHVTSRRFFREAAAGGAKAKSNKVTEQEQAEKEKDEEFLRRCLIGLGCLVVISPAIYLGDKWGRQQYWGTPGETARVSTSSHGKPSLGGPFTLVTTDGKPVSQAEFLGKWQIFYFGFVHCPEICPVELNRMTIVVDNVKKAKPDVQMQPLFVSCDPKRDSLFAIKEYLSVFHKDFIGLVGTPEQVNQTCKSYRIYYSVPDEKAAEGEDYLIDHSIAIFLFDPNGQFVDFFGTRYNENEITEKVLTYIDNLEKDPKWTNW